MSAASSILVVEDDRESRELLAYLLRARGFEPRLAVNGADGVRMALEEPPDLILLDIRMPELDGYQVVAALKPHPQLAQTRIVAVTASAMIDDRERIAAAGFDGYIRKPIDPETFVDDIMDFLADPDTSSNC